MRSSPRTSSPTYGLESTPERSRALQRVLTGDSSGAVTLEGDQPAHLRHAQFAITMEIYTEVSSAATRAGLKRLSESLEG